MDTLNKKTKENIMIKETLTIEQAQDMFNDYLDSDSDGLILIAGLTFLASEVLEKMDPIAYREEFLAYVNAISYDFEIEGY